MTDTLSWPNEVSPEQLEIYLNVIQEAGRRGIRFALGGSAALGFYTGIRRRSKDLDLYVEPRHRDELIAVLKDEGMRDYYDQVPYDRGWIYRATKDDVIIDVIWQMANRRAPVDAAWLNRGPEMEIPSGRVRLVPIEETIWSRLYVVQRDRCDWPDIWNLIECAAGRIDWEYLFSRIGEDAPLLRAILVVYGWLRPQSAAAKLPEWIKDQIRLEDPGADQNLSRAALLDSREWLACAAEQVSDECLSVR